MTVNKSKIENNNKTSSLNIKKAISDVLLISSIIGCLCYYFVTDKKSIEEPIQEVTEKDQKEEAQPELIINNEYIPLIDRLWLNIPFFINNEYIPVIDCLWLNILSFLIVAIIVFFIVTITLVLIFEILLNFLLKNNLSIFIIVFIISYQVIFYAIWFILMLIFAGFSKIWDKEHSWWQNVKKGFFRNQLYKGRLLLIPILSPIIAVIFFVSLICGII